MRKFVLYVCFAIILCACSSSPEPKTATPTPTLTPPPTKTAKPAPSKKATLEPLPLLIDPDLPGASPERFGERFFSGSFHSAPVFSPDGSTVWWGGEYGSADIYTSQRLADGWTNPAVVRFSEGITSYRDPFISPDGQKFYFISTAAIPGSNTSKENLWMMEKEGDGWGEPLPLAPSINALALHWTVSVADNYNLYFSAVKEENTDIFLSEYINGEYMDPIQLDAPINTAEMEITPNIAPDESFLLFTRIASRTAPPHLYISYKVDFDWTEPERVENVSYCISPIVTPDRSFVIYLSSPSSFDWRDTSFIEELRP